MAQTSVAIGQRTKKSPDNEFGWKEIEAIPEDEVCLVVLGGNGTDSNKASNGLAKRYEELLEDTDIKDKVNIYVVSYRYNTADDERSDIFFLQQKSREFLLKQHHRNLEHPMVTPLDQKDAMFNEERRADIIEKHGQEYISPSNPEISSPAYIQELFDKVFLKRISQNGQRLPEEEALKRIGKLNIAVHCHGGYVFLKLEEMMQQKMLKLGYTKEQRAHIQKELLCVAHAPYCPLGVSKSTMISFASASDEEIWHQNAFQREIQNLNRQHKLRLSYFPKKQGEVFIAPRITMPDPLFDARQQSMIEHGFTQFKNSSKPLSKEGEALMLFEGNTLINGIRRSLKGQLLPDTKDLVCGGNEASQALFDSVAHNGETAWQQITDNATLQAQIAHLTKVKDLRTL